VAWSDVDSGAVYRVGAAPAPSGADRTGASPRVNPGRSALGGCGIARPASGGAGTASKDRPQFPQNLLSKEFSAPHAAHRNVFSAMESLVELSRARNKARLAQFQHLFPCYHFSKKPPLHSGFAGPDTTGLPPVSRPDDWPSETAFP